ncbi:protein of unknown function [Bradyrhizobium vignae]|uniref:Uncharacterized protein n=1 Tax=Bradyrhizobium vignae TaxID=1549949 RepID=A0A2U3Q474_9BRAD|nr:protein of unknown function [Bradyrhizobium vignae]
MAVRRSRCGWFMRRVIAIALAGASRTRSQLALPRSECRQALSYIHQPIVLAASDA